MIAATFQKIFRHRMIVLGLAAFLLMAMGTAFFLMATGTAAISGAETNVSTGLTAKGAGLAVHGYDVVAYFTDAQPKIGRAEYSTVYKDATYRFESEQHLTAFEANPAKYVPQYGGFCAYGVAVGAKFDGDPRLWRIVDGKLFLNLNQDIQKTWEKDIPGHIQKADRNWTKIATRASEELSYPYPREISRKIFAKEN